MAKIYGTPIMAGGAGGANKDLPPLLDNFKAFEGGVVDDGLTRLKDLPNGTKVKFGNYNDQTLVWRIAQDEGITKAVLDLDYNTGKTVIGDMVVSPNKSICGNWAITGWLNATEVGDSWWDNRVRYSGYPSETEPTYSSQDGFLHGWSVADKEVLRGVVWDCDDKRSSPNSYQLWCRLMIASKDEVELAWNGERFCASLGTAACMTRTSHVHEEYYAISPMGTSISAGGYITNENLNQPQGIWPVCAPNPEAVVSDEPDDDGCYTIDYTKRTVGDLQVGDKIKVSVNADAQSFLGENIVFQVAAHNHPTHPENSATLITEKIIANLPYDARGDKFSVGNNAEFQYSDLYQWMNSKATAGQWWSSKFDGDVAPSEGNVGINPYTDKAGFLNMLDASFVGKLLKTHRKNVTSENLEYEFDTLLFLTSEKEVNAKGNSSSTCLLIFTDDDSRIAYPTQECINNSEDDVNLISPESPFYWWKETVVDGNSSSAEYVNLTGGFNVSISSRGLSSRGIRPACNISNSLPLVSGTPDEEGCYLVDWNKINVTIQADKMATSRANELTGAVWVYGDHEPTSVNDGTKIQLTREEVVTSDGGEAQTVTKTVEWNNEANFFARQFTYNSKKQYQTMLEGAIATITLVGVPEPVSELAEQHSGSSITLTWKNPTSDELYDHTVVVYKTDAFPTSIDDGTQGYSGTDETATLSGLELGSTYYIAVFTVSAYGLYGVPQTVQVDIPAGQLLSSLASGTKVKLGQWNGTDLQWKVARDTSDQSIRLVLEPTSVSLLGNKMYDNKEPSNSDSDRRSYGNNRYIYSNIHQWLNATKATGWYTAQHSTDAAPDYSSQAGFLSGWSENHIAALDRATLTVSCSSTDGGGTETFVARVALMSTTELGLQSGTGGGRLDIFNSDRDRSTGAYYWTRTPLPSFSNIAYQVTSAGALHFSGGVYDAHGVRPLCIPVSTALVSLEMDDDNCYVVQ